MKRQSRYLAILGCIVLFTVASHATVAFHTSTAWDLRPSLKYDTLCILNVLSGDPYYLRYYNETDDRLQSQFTSQEKTAFKNLKAKIKDEHGGIISAMLSLYFSTVNAETLDDMIRVARDSSEMKRALHATPYYNDDGWKTYEAARPDLQAALVTLKRIHFDDFWEKNIRPVIEQRRSELLPELPQYNIVSAIESRLGHPFPSNTITVYLLYYSEPHGIKIVGTNFITHYSYPLRIVMRNAIHEMMHPPYDAADPAVTSAIESLRGDSFLMEKVQHHDPSFGYNTLEGFVEEDCVQALEQNVAEQFDRDGDLKGNPQKYWTQQDGGMHVLAVALYELMKDENFPQSGETFPKFFVRMVRAGRLSNSSMEALNKRFFAGNQLK